MPATRAAAADTHGILVWIDTDETSPPGRMTDSVRDANVLERCITRGLAMDTPRGRTAITSSGAEARAIHH